MIRAAFSSFQTCLNSEPFVLPSLSFALTLIFLRSNKLVGWPNGGGGGGGESVGGGGSESVNMQTGCQSTALLKPRGHLNGRGLASLFSLWDCWQTWHRLHCIWTGLSLQPHISPIAAHSLLLVVRYDKKHKPGVNLKNKKTPQTWVINCNQPNKDGF